MAGTLIGNLPERLTFEPTDRLIIDPLTGETSFMYREMFMSRINTVTLTPDMGNNVITTINGNLNVLNCTIIHFTQNFGILIIPSTSTITFNNQSGDKVQVKFTDKTELLNNRYGCASCVECMTNQIYPNNYTDSKSEGVPILANSKEINANSKTLVKSGDIIPATNERFMGLYCRVKGNSVYMSTYYFLNDFNNTGITDLFVDANTTGTIYNLQCTIPIAKP